MTGGSTHGSFSTVLKSSGAWHRGHFYSEIWRTSLISIIIPVYKEVENIFHVSHKINEVLDNARIEYEIIFVDDNSCDGTSQLCQKLSKQLPVKLIIRKQDKSLSYSVIEGLGHAQGDILVVMDADLSHPPSAILEMKNLLESKKADLVVGSRYVKGGSIDKEWSLCRHLNSYIATVLALPLAKIKDPMSGFFALRCNDLPDIKILSPIGYKICLEIIVKGKFKRIKEVPIHFSDRKFGESKLRFEEQLFYLVHVFCLYQFLYPKIIKFVLFTAAGFTGFLVVKIFV